jgi:hypothetical protein
MYYGNRNNKNRKVKIYNSCDNVKIDAHPPLEEKRINNSSNFIKNNISLNINNHIKK